MSLFWAPGLVARFNSAEDPADAIRQVGGLLVAADAATPKHVEAAAGRELKQPTGLPAIVPFALVHTDAAGALKAAAALGVFAHPVPFRRMDHPGQVLPVQLVVMLTVPQRSLQAETLGKLIRTLADGAVATKLLRLEAGAAQCLLAAKAA